MCRKQTTIKISLMLVILFIFSASSALAQTQTPLPGSAIAQFVDPLPNLLGADSLILAGAGQIELQMREFQANVMPTGFVPATGTYTGTWVWGYLQPGQSARTSYLGPVILATKSIPTEIKFVNDLGTTGTTNVLAYKNSTDQTLHWANPLNADMMDRTHYGDLIPAPIPAVPHLHGGEIPPVLDGGPDAWFTSSPNPDGSGSIHGSGFYSKDGNTDKNWAIYRYTNSQDSALIWFHDHTLGATRLNVYAGLAGAHLIVDPADILYPLGPASPPPVPLVIQDRMFDTNGQLFFPAGVPYTPNWDHPFWVPEFVGDTIVVNGKVWPYLEVQPKRYRFLTINGSNARTYEMFLVNPVTKVMGPAMWQVGTDGGYLDAPVKIDPNAPAGQMKRLVMMPGERADIIIDFAGLAPGTTLILRNVAKTPYPAGASPNGNTIGRIMQFRVIAGGGADASYNPASGGALRDPLALIPRLVDPVAGALAPGITIAKTRQLTLNEVMGMPMTVGGVAYPGGPLEILVNNTKWNGIRADGTIRADFTPITIGGVTNYYSELMNEGQTEVWEIVNLTADAHPMHTHLTQVQLMNRQGFNTNKYNAAYATAFTGGLYIPGDGPPLDYNTGNTRALGGNPDITPFLQGPVRPPASNEAGWKDTVMVPPGMVTRFVVRFAPVELGIGLDPAEYVYPFDPNAKGHGYVWHCHIVDHEDNEMMRPDIVYPKEGITELLRAYKMGLDY